MKTSCFAVIPSEVRYDKNLIAQDILLYAEISASASTDGVCTLSNYEFAKNMRVDERSISRYLRRLIDCGHIEIVRNGNHRAIKLTFHGTGDSNYSKETVVDEYQEFYDELLSLWGDTMHVKVEKPELYHQRIRQRLITFSTEELKEAILNRASFVKSSEWHQEPENIVHATNIDIVLRNDESVLKWLNTKQTQTKTNVTPFNFN